ncbi:[protein-PII] uridylyltransferase [Pelagicoccus sp. SDUM812002]|uniref:[protein-PII] uridylyltransferase n=1 Tax=Pelagicoccus sp. SDUM812002 TaxID=3041266 RepID=UPI00280FFEDA|nr:[protein-PII] uridylyltransferase [Pelagicoccus sp. SDUM812002]MDQ8187059.1 [protein-PII] uridylyltransferase [Pelagicoccus sp. SDUM812002]
MIQAFTKRLKNDASAQLAFTSETKSAEKLAALKGFLKSGTETILAEHRNGAPGLEIARARSLMIDTVITYLAEPAMAEVQKLSANSDISISVVALGGYGREELCPLSDIDIMFLYPSDTDGKLLGKAQELLVQEVLYPLWDAGLKVGHSTRSVEEAFKEAKADIQTKTALLEARRICGSAPLFDGFQKSYHLFYRKDDPKEYIKQRLDDQRSRRAKFGGSIYMQEPDIKSGVGGLRDYHNTLWMAQVRLNLKDMAGLVPLNYLSKQELEDIRAAYEFLIRVRNELHFRVKRPTDLLSLELQPKVAYRLGYKQRDILERVEGFMRDYYKRAQIIYRVSKNIEKRLALTSKQESKSPLESVKSFLLARRKERVKKVDGFLIRGQEITFEDDKVFIEEPNRLIRIFRHSQQNGVEIDFELNALIRASLGLVDDEVRQSPEANLSFRTIMQEAGNVYPTLNEMHELGVLGAFIPEWGKLTCLVQHEYYHRYTADVHTLHTIRELDEIFSNPKDIYKSYREALHELRLPNLIYLILLLHDIGKARGIRNHAENGVEIADPILDRLQIDEENRASVRFIIKNHLQMARFWQRFDIDDPDTAKAFAEQVESPELLRLLYVHTFCDAKGTAAGLWNQYKDTLHRTLYRRALDVFKSEGKLDQHYEQHKKMTQQELHSIDIEGVGSEEVDAHFKLLPDRYFINTSKEEIIKHIQMINDLIKAIAKADSIGALKPIIDWKHDVNRSLTVVNIVTWDRAGLFHKLAGALNIAGYSILSAKAISRDDHIAIDTFYVTESGRGPSDETKAKEAFANAVKDALVSNEDLYPRILDMVRKEAADIFSKNDDNPLAESFEPQVDVYHELSLQRTILEVQAPDHLGLLYQISHQISKHGFDITFARINTERGIAIDTLYLSELEPGEDSDGEKLMELRESLTKALTANSKPS